MPFSGEAVFRRDEAAALRLALAQGGADAFRQMEQADVTSLARRRRPSETSHARRSGGGHLHAALLGHRTLERSGASRGGGSVAFQFDNDMISWQPDFERPDGPFKTAPFAARRADLSAVQTETVILPAGGTGFTIVGHDLDRISSPAFTSARSLRWKMAAPSPAPTFRQMDQLEISAAERRGRHRHIERDPGRPGPSVRGARPPP